MQERPHWQTTENDDDKPAAPGFGSLRSERPAEPVRPAVERTQPPAPPRAALEGVISWRHTEDVLAQSAKDEKHEDDDEEDEDDTPRARPVTLAKKAVDKDQTPAAGDKEDEAPISFPSYPAPAPQREVAPITELYDLDDEAWQDEPVPARRAPAMVPSQAAGLSTAATLRGSETAPDHADHSEDLDALQPLEPYRQILDRSQEPAVAVEPQAHAERNDDDFDVGIYPAPPTKPASGTGRPPIPPAGPPAESAGYEPPEGPLPPFIQQSGNYPPPPAGYQATAGRMPGAERAGADHHRHPEPLAAAVGVGLAAEHIWNRGKHKQHAKALETFTQDQAAQQKEAAAYTQRMQEQQRSFAAEQQHQTAELQRMRAEQERLAAAASAQQYNLEQAPSTVTSQPVQRFEAAQPAPPPEAFQPGTTPPLPPIERMQQQAPEQRAPMPVAPTEQQQFDGQLAPEGTPPEPKQHFEQSAWHKIAVDSHNHEMAGVINYGKEFHDQQRHEMLQDRTSAGYGGDAAAGGGTIQGAGYAGQPTAAAYQQQSQATLPSGMTNPTLPAGAPTHADPQHQLPAHRKQATSNIANPWFWLMLILIVAAFFTAALI